MQVKNLSTRHPTHKLQPLIDFVASRTRRHSKVALYLDDQSSRQITVGAAHPGIHGVVNPCIRMTLSRGLGRYPRKTTHVDEVGTILLESWEEEVVLVLAHELRHIEQFSEGKQYEYYEAEVDAERFGLKVLQQYRVAQSRFATRAA
jgi:hypothetical protein